MWSTIRREALFCAQQPVTAWNVSLAIGAGLLSTAVATSPTSYQSDQAVVWAVGDMCAQADRRGDCAAVAELVANDPAADAFLMLGDAQYEDGTRAQYDAWYAPKVDAEVGEITRPVPGNHDYHTDDAAGYFGFFGSRAGERSEGYYSFAVGAWRIVAANSNCGQVGGCGGLSPQGEMIRQALARPESCELMFAHHPPYSDGSHGDTAQGKQLFTVGYNNGADLYLAGHDHGYQRFAPREPDGSGDPEGLRSFVVGTGGAELTSWSRSARSDFRQNTRAGAMRLVLGPDGYTGRFVAVDGTVLDTFSGSCR